MGPEIGKRRAGVAVEAMWPLDCTICGTVSAFPNRQDAVDYAYIHVIWHRNQGDAGRVFTGSDAHEASRRWSGDGNS